jgi:ABC-type Co2+ transport system permease subunit
VAIHFGWCAWSLPRYGVVTSHGVETAACNWGTQLLAAMVGGLAALMAASGALRLWLRSRPLAWWLSHLPALGGWGWLLLGVLEALLGRS